MGESSSVRATPQLRIPAWPQVSAWAVRRRWWVLAGWTAVWTAAMSARPHEFGWHYFVTGAGQLTSERALRLFVDHPELQTGPVSVAVVVPLVKLFPAGLAREGAVVLMAAVGLLALRLAELAVTAEPTARTNASPWSAPAGACDVAPPSRTSWGAPPARVPMGVLVAGLLAVPVWAQLAVVWSHPDDVIAVTCAAAAVVQLRQDRTVVAAVLLGLAVDAKPWALMFFPLLLLAGPSRRRVAAAAAVFAVVVAAAWLPFVTAVPATVTAADFTIPVSSQSVLHLIGIGGRTPTWCRTAQLLVGAGAVAAAVLRGRWQYGLLAGVAARLLLDPAAKPYYAAGAAAAAVIVDLAARRVVPWWTVTVFVGLYALPMALGDTGTAATAAGVVRLLVLLAALAAAVATIPRSQLVTSLVASRAHAADRNTAA